LENISNKNKTRAGKTKGVVSYGLKEQVQLLQLANRKSNILVTLDTAQKITLQGEADALAPKNLGGGW